LWQFSEIDSLHNEVAGTNNAPKTRQIATGETGHVTTQAESDDCRVSQRGSFLVHQRPDHFGYSCSDSSRVCNGLEVERVFGTLGPADNDHVVVLCGWKIFRDLQKMVSS